MSTATPERLGRHKAAIWRYVHDCFNQGSEQAARDICHPLYRNDSSVLAVPDGPEGLVANIRNGRATIDGMRLEAVALVAEGDDAILLRHSAGTLGRYLGDSGSDVQVTQWSLGSFGFEDGLLRHHVSNWEPLRGMAQGGQLDALLAKANGRRVPDFEAMGLRAPRLATARDFLDRAATIAVRPPGATERLESSRLMAETTHYSLGARTQARATELLATGARLNFADWPDEVGPDGMTARRAAFNAAFADTEITVHKLLVESGRAAIRFTLSATHAGPWIGLPATGRTVKASGAAMARIADGRVTEWIELIDLLRVVRQIGGLAAVMPGCYPDQ